MTLSAQDIKEIVEFTDIEQFEEKIDKCPNLLKEDLGNLVVELFEKGKVSFFAHLLEQGLYSQTTLGEFSQSMLGYLAENETIPGRDEFIDILLNTQNYDVNYVGEVRSTSQSPLYIAIDRNDFDLFEKLIRHPQTNLKHTVSVINDLGLLLPIVTPLMLAIQQRKLNLALKLLDSPKNSDERQEAIGEYNSFVSCLFRHAETVSCKEGNVETSNFTEEWQKLIEKALPMLRFKDENCESKYFFHFLAQEKNPLTLKTLFEFCNFDVNSSLILTGTKDTLAVAATKKNNLDLLKILQSKKFNLHGGFFTPLFVAVSQGKNLELVRFLIDSVNLSSDFENVLDALSWINFNLSETFTEEEKNDFIAFTKGVFEALSDANTDIKKLLLRNTRSNVLDTPLKSSIDSKNPVLFKILLEKENENGIPSLVDGNVLRKALNHKKTDIVSHILAQAGSSNSVPKETLEEIAKGLDCFYIQNREYLKLLDEAISKSLPLSQFQIPPKSTSLHDRSHKKDDSSDIFIVRWLKTFDAWVDKMIDRICNFFTGNAPRNTSNKIIKGEKGKEIGSAPSTTPNKNQGNEQNAR